MYNLLQRAISTRIDLSEEALREAGRSVGGAKSDLSAIVLTTVEPSPNGRRLSFRKSLLFFAPIFALACAQESAGADSSTARFLSDAVQTVESYCVAYLLHYGALIMHESGHALMHALATGSWPAITVAASDSAKQAEPFDSLRLGPVRFFYDDPSDLTSGGFTVTGIRSSVPNSVREKIEQCAYYAAGPVAGIAGLLILRAYLPDNRYLVFVWLRDLVRNAAQLLPFCDSDGYGMLTAFGVQLPDVAVSAARVLFEAAVDCVDIYGLKEKLTLRLFGLMIMPCSFVLMPDRIMIAPFLVRLISALLYGVLLVFDYYDPAARIADFIKRQKIGFIQAAEEAAQTYLPFGRVEDIIKTSVGLIGACMLFLIIKAAGRPLVHGMV